jgi:hypothetical protein
MSDFVSDRYSAAGQREHDRIGDWACLQLRREPLTGIMAIVESHAKETIQRSIGSAAPIAVEPLSLRWIFGARVELN